MAFDFAIDFKTGDLVISPHNDIERRVGFATLEQRIRVRLRIYQGVWLLDPTDGQLGSRLHEALRYPVWRMNQEIPLMVREALAPMEELIVRDVIVEQKDVRTIGFTILFSTVEPNGQASDTISQLAAQLQLPR